MQIYNINQGLSRVDFFTLTSPLQPILNKTVTFKYNCLILVIMKPIYHYTTVLEALEDLKEKGFDHDFNLHLETIKKNPHDYAVKHVYRYEGDSNPDEESVVYGIISNSGTKGVFVAGFSANSDNEAAEILEKLYIESNI